MSGTQRLDPRSDKRRLACLRASYPGGTRKAVDGSNEPRGVRVREKSPVTCERPSHSGPRSGPTYVMSFCVVNKHFTLHTAFHESARSYGIAIEKFPLPNMGKPRYVRSVEEMWGGGFTAVVWMFEYSIQRCSIVTLGKPNLERRERSLAAGVESSTR